FDWMNGFHPEVQDFLLSLIIEVIQNYKIDGIQGDDRLPAMPVESGYDYYTMIEYKKEHNGKLPPADCYDKEWINWRADRLNKFMKRIYDTVKNYNKDLIVSMAPSIYPWAKEEYLQDWPTWVKNGWVDLIIPQLYRYRIEDYVELLNDIVNNQIEPKNLKKFVPGILLKLGDYYPEEEFLTKMINENRKRGINGEVFFFYEGIKKFEDLFIKKLYGSITVFPKLTR
ncbi:MAG: family 10 glycosylhydrolase, partial [Ignavibacteria bacterium]|nr:family 10 glycosylhydrolase [Ignavibacteria bacterium]